MTTTWCTDYATIETYIMTKILYTNYATIDTYTMTKP